ncbi:MAG: DUF4058 family protein [Isosphaeraceae bacterium]
MVSRAEKRRVADFWPIGLRDRLPIIPVPLRSPDSSAQVDLQEALHRAYDGPGYEHFIYRGEPEPKLSARDSLVSLHPRATPHPPLRGTFCQREKV